MKAMKKSSVIILLGFSLVLFSCNAADDKINFKSNWDTMNDRTRACHLCLE